jgi:hypothetical protein
MPPQDDSPYPRHEPQRSTASVLWWPVLAVVLVAAAAAWYWWRPSPAAPKPVARAEPAKPATPAPAEPAIRHPLAAAEPAAQPLPALEASDAPFLEALAGLLGRKSLADLLRPEKIIRNVVATVDNLPRAAAPSRVNPLQPTPGRFAVQGGQVAASNAARYAERLRLLQSVDARRLVDLYVFYYPLFQKAYVELGYPGRYFNDRLVEALDDLLAAPESSAPIRVEQPKVLYHYADPQLEARSAGQKIMMRIGSNQGLAKAKLREIRREILARSPDRPAR